MAIGFVAPRHRMWPPRHRWQIYVTWILSWVSLSGVFLLAIFSENSLHIHNGLRLGVGVPLFVFGVSMIAWGFRELSIQTTLATRAA